MDRLFPGAPDLAGADLTDTELDDLANQLATQLAQLGDVRRQAAGISVTETGGDGIVRVTVSASGAVTGLEFSDEIRSISARILADIVLGCLQRAQSRIADQVERIAAEVAPEAAAVTGPAVARLRRQFQPPG